MGLKRGREYDCEDDSRGAGNSRYAITFGDVAVLHVGWVPGGIRLRNTNQTLAAFGTVI